MHIDDYQLIAARTINRELTNEQMEDHALHLIASECGEIHGIYQKVYQGHPLNETALLYELGDLLWGIAELCTAKEWNMDAVAKQNIKKLLERYPDGFDPERSVHREDEK